MEISDIIELVKGHVDNMETGDAGFRELFDELKNADGGLEQLRSSIQLWLHMEANKYIPEDLDEGDDGFLARALISFADTYELKEPMEYAFVLMYHRLMLSDYLEKADIAEVFLTCLVHYRKLVDEIINAFIEKASDDAFYMASMDPEDVDPNNPLLPNEMMRALLPYLRWMKETYPQYANYEELLTDDYLQMMSAYEESRIDSKPALKKLSSLCHFLYEDIHSRE